MAWSYTYDIDTPSGDDDPAEADDRMREIKGGLQERLNVEHVFDLTGSEVSHANTGKHTDITTTSIVNAGVLTQTGNFTLNTDKFTVDAATGNVVVAGTLSVTGIATLGDGSKMATSAPPAADAELANKKFVEDQDTADHPAYTGGESHTDGSGLITKMGRSAAPIGDIGAGSITITFDTPFPNECKSAVASLHINTASQMFWFTDNPSTTGFIFRWFEYAGTHNLDGFDWIAKGW